MNNQFQVLNSMLDQAQECNEKGDTAAASSIVHMIRAECLVILSEKVYEIEKHLSVIANLGKDQLFREAKQEKPVKLANPSTPVNRKLKQ